MNQATFLFFGDISVFLKKKWQHCRFEYAFNSNQSVKHLIEAIGVPHTEICKIVVNGSVQSYDYLVKDGDSVEVYPFDFTQDKDYPTNQGKLGFVLDNHLGKLASHLRMLGFDCIYQNDFQDVELVEISQLEDRILLSRDRRLFMRKVITKGYWLRSKYPIQQLREVIQRYNLYSHIQPLTRCMCCNGQLKPIPKDEIIDRLEPLTKIHFNEFSICLECKKIYWKGSHYEKMMSVIKSLLNENG